MIEVAWSDEHSPYYSQLPTADFKILNTQLQSLTPLSSFEGIKAQDAQVQAFMADDQSDRSSAGVLAVRWSEQALKADYPIHDMVACLKIWPVLNAHHGVLATVLSEAFSNALEHGILKLDSHLKQSAAGMAEYYQLREQALQQLTSGWIKLHLSWTQSHVQLKVQDSGGGFDVDKSKAAGIGALAGRGRQLLDGLGTLRYADNGATLMWQAPWDRLS